MYLSKKRVKSFGFGTIILMTLSLTLYKRWYDEVIPIGDLLDLQSGCQVQVIVGEGGFEHQIVEQSSQWVAFQDMNPAIAQMLILHEDNGFWIHDGVNFGRLRTVINRNLFHGEELHGASTISMQIVKNLFLSSEKNTEKEDH